jgi:hypothetical protein
MIRGAFQRIVRHFVNSFFDECMQAALIEGGVGPLSRRGP